MGNTQSITFKGSIPSLNSYAGGKNFYAKAKVIKDIKSDLRLLCIKAGFYKVDKFCIDVEFNSRHDVDNVVTIEKIFVDSLKGRYIEDDNKKYFRGLSIRPNEELPMNTFILSVISI
jgi:hypothetical protein